MPGDKPARGPAAGEGVRPTIYAGGAVMGTVRGIASFELGKYIGVQKESVHKSIGRP